MRRVLFLLFVTGCSGTSGDPLAVDGGDEASINKDAAKMDSSMKSDAPVGMNFQSTPGQIDCGKQSCPSMSGFSCCMTVNGNMMMFSCMDPGTCTQDMKSAEIECDEAADCAQGQVCCRSAVTAMGSHSKCATSCGNDAQLCKKTSECVTGACKAWACPAPTSVTACTQPAGCM